MSYKMGISKLKAIDYKLLLRRLILLALSTRLFIHLFYAPENWTQIPKDLEYTKAFILLLVIVAIYRGIKPNDWKAWLYVLLSIGVGIICFKVRGYTPEAYGELLFQYMEVRAVMQLLFIGLMLDLLRHKPYKWDIFLKNPAVIFYVLFSIIFIATDYTVIVPFVCPMSAVFLTHFDKKTGKEFMFVIAGGIYLAFVKCFTQSLIENPNNYDADGRYYGSFISLAVLGFSCGCALAAMVFFTLYFKEKQNKIGMITSMVLAVYPMIAIWMCGLRTNYLGIFTMVMGLFAFMYSKGTKSTLRRLIITIGLIIIGLFSMFGLSKILATMVESGTLNESELDYFMHQIYEMTTCDEPQMNLEVGSFWYMLDVLTSERISIWYEAIKQIRFIGHPIGYDLAGNNIGSPLIPHNMFITVMVRYGVIGAIPFISWWTACIYRAYRQTQENYISKLWIILWLSFMFGVYSVHYEMFECIGGTVLLLSTLFLIIPKDTANDEEILCAKE